MSEYAEKLDIPFVVDSDEKAEWALHKIEQIRKEADKWKTFYADQARKAQEKAEADESYFLALLESYFAFVPHKSTKTQESYALPSGKLVRKVQQPAYNRDDARLLPWAKENALCKVVESPDWASIKKRCIINGENVVDSETGEVIPGVTVEHRGTIFSVSIKEE